MRRLVCAFVVANPWRQVFSRWGPNLFGINGLKPVYYILQYSTWQWNGRSGSNIREALQGVPGHIWSSKTLPIKNANSFYISWLCSLFALAPKYALFSNGPKPLGVPYLCWNNRLLTQIAICSHNVLLHVLYFINILKQTYKLLDVTRNCL